MAGPWKDAVHALRCRHRDLGWAGPQRPQRARRRHGLRPEMSRRWKRLPRSICFERLCPLLENSRHQRRRPDHAAAEDLSSPWYLGRDFDFMFTCDRPVISAYHGYPWLIHRLAYRRTNHPDMHVHGFRGRLDDDTVRHGRAQSAGSLPPRHRRDRSRPGAGRDRCEIKQAFRDKLVEHTRYIRSMARICPKSRSGSGLTRRAPKPAIRAFSSEVITGSRKEKRVKIKKCSRSDLIGTEKALEHDELKLVGAAVFVCLAPLAGRG